MPPDLEIKLEIDSIKIFEKISGTRLPTTASMTSLRIAPTELDCWSTEDDELTLQYPAVLRNFPRDRDTISMMSADSTDSSRGSHFSANHSDSLFVAAGDIRRRLSESLKGENKSRKNLKRDPDDPSAAVLKEPWDSKVSKKKYSNFELYLTNFTGAQCLYFCHKLPVHSPS